MHVCSECGQGYERPGYCAADGHPLADATDPVLGTEVLRYRLARLIGRGGMGNVYLGVQPQIGSRVAVKILSQECAREPDLVERFFAEARAVNLIRHENIVSVIDMARLPDGRPFIVMEYIEGVTLGKAIEGGQAPLGGIVQVFTDVLGALDAAHAIGIVHRDLKPDNILLTGKGHAKVLDFGIAKLAPALRGDAGASPRTATGALLGTPAYMAPEQISGSESVDGRSDVYAAGIVLFEAVTGRVPFAGATLFDMMRAQIEQPPPSPRSFRSDLPPQMEAVILTALAKKPHLRFQSAGAMANALEQASMELPQHQWRELSTRSAPITRGSTPRVRRPTTEPPPMTLDRNTPPAISAVNVPQSEKRARRREKKSGSSRPLVLAVLGMGVAGGVGAIVAIAATRQETSAPPAPVVVATSIDATPSAPQVIDAAAIATTVDAAPIQVAVAPPPKRPPGRPTTHNVPPERPQPPVVDQAPAAAPTSSDPKRAAKEKIANDFKMHPDHVAIPGEVPIKRMPRMSRGSYNAANFDYKAFLPQATKLARAEASDAQWLSFEVHGVAPDGHANIAHDGAEYRFVTEKPFDEGCVIVIDVLANKIETYLQGPAICNKPSKLPRCSFTQIWTKARALGSAANVATLSFQTNWTFSASDLMYTIPDDCP